MAYKHGCNCASCKSTRQWHKRKAKFVPMVIHHNGGIWLHGCSGYNAGFVKPRYPVPAIRNNDVYGGIEGDWLLVGAWYLDWSKGKLERY
jgi:hypothetical protein